MPSDADKKDTKALVQDMFGKHAEGYVSSQGHAKGRDLERLFEITAPQADWLALDVATGGGHTALRIAPHVKHMTASDLTPRMLEKAESFIREQGVTNVTFKQADAEDLPFDEASFDLVTCRIAPHHFPNPPQFVAEAARVLKAGGLLVVQDHVMPDDAEASRYIDHFETLRDPSHHHALSEKEWRAAFEQAGLSIEHVEQLVKRHEFIPWAERMSAMTDTIAELERLLREAPPIAHDWMLVENVGEPGATFVNQNILIKGRKG